MFMLRKDTDQMEIKFLQLFFFCMIGEATGIQYRLT